MSKREIIMPPAAVPFEIGGHALRLTCIAGNQIRVETPEDGLPVRGIRVTADDTYIRNDAGEWESWSETRSRFPMTVRRFGTFDDGTPAQRKVVTSLMRQAAVAFAEAHPEKLAEAGVMAANNDVYRADAELAKAEKAYTDALDVRTKALAREREALDTAAAYAESLSMRR